MTKKSCKKGYYYCFTSKKCKKIPVGYHVMTSGRLMKDSEHKEEEETKKNGNGTNGNGNGNGDSSGISDGGGVSEGWSAKYKRSIDCDNPKGFSQRAHCQGRKKVNEAKEKGDHEYSMARSQLATVMSAAKRLRAKMKGEGEIEAWVQSKITKAADYLDSAADYVDSGEMNEGKNGRCPEGQYYCYTNKECRPIPKGFMVDPEGMLRKENGASIDESKSGDSSLRDWFTKSRASDGTPGWVQLGGKYAGKPCAKQPGQTTKPKCGSSKMKADLSDKEEERAFRRKNQEDPNPDRKGKAKMVATEEKDACYSKVKSRYSVWPSAYASGALVKCRKVGAKNWGNKTQKEGYEFSNWRDDFKATEYETVDIIETTPLKESEEIRYCPKCKKNEKKRECRYGEKYWTMFSLPASLGGGGAYDPNEVHPANEGLSFEIGGGHKKAQKMGKIRNLSKGATGGEKDAAQAALKRLGGGISLPLADQVIYPGQLKTEDYQRLQSTGNVFSIMLMWRGKTYRLQLFFSGPKRPSREEVNAEIQKFYPGGVLTHYYPSPSDPSQPIVVIQR